MKTRFIAILLIVLSLSAHGQQSVTITASKDNTLYQTVDGSTSNGAGVGVFTGRTNQSGNNLRRAVIKFDLAGNLPANAVITGARLKLNMSKSVTGASLVKVHRLLSDWGEGTSDAGSGEGGGATSTTNDATWLHKFFNTQSWASPGGDFVSLASASKSVSGNGSYTWEDTLLWADVLVWQQTPSLNFGWILIGDESAQSAKRFDSRNHATAANRPQLIIDYTTSTAVSNASVKPAEFSLGQNYPNPFNPSTTIVFSVPNDGRTTLAVYDLLGNRVAMLVNEYTVAGTHQVSFDGSTLATGIYFYRLQSGGFSSIKKLMLLK